MALIRRFGGDRATAPAGGSLLPALLVLAASLVAWSFGEDWREETAALMPQLDAAAATLRRTGSGGDASARPQAERLRERRRVAEQRLQEPDGVEMVRARLGSRLRRVCVDAGAANCAVRIAEDAIAAPANIQPEAMPAREAVGASAVSAGPSGSLSALGVQRARAVLSGVFRSDEPAQIVAALNRDGRDVWRVNGLVVRNDTFELDVERLFIVQTPIAATLADRQASPGRAAR